MNAGIFTNPPVPGSYATTASFTSVDPDTDGADNSAGDPPMTLDFSENVVIAGKAKGAPWNMILLDDAPNP